MKTKITKIAKYLYIVSLYKNGVWLKYSQKGMCLADAKAAQKRIEKW